MSMNNTNTIVKFLEKYCFDNYEVACYWLNMSENMLTDLMAYPDDKFIDKKLIDNVKGKMAFGIPKDENKALTDALYDASIRIEEWENNALILLKGGSKLQY